MQGQLEAHQTMGTLRWRLPHVNCNPYDLSARLSLRRFVYQSEFLWNPCSVVDSQYSFQCCQGPHFCMRQPT